MKNLETDFYYPSTNYFNFSNGVPLDETTVNMWIQEMFVKIKTKISEYPDRESYFHHMSSGNTKVIMECYRQGDKDKFTVYVSVATAYSTRTLTDVKL